MSISQSSTTQTFHEIIEERQKALQLTNLDISDALGFASSSFWSLVMQRKVTFPINRLSALVEIMEIDPGTLTRAWMSEYAPEVLALVDEHLLTATGITVQEQALLNACRHLSKGRDVMPTVIDGNAIVALVVA